MKKTHRLVIIYNQFHADRPTKYMEVIYDPSSSSLDERELKRKPRTARFDEVFETGDGSYNQWNAHRAKRLHGHPLQRK